MFFLKFYCDFCLQNSSKIWPKIFLINIPQKSRIMFINCWHNVSVLLNCNKKFELMLTRRAKAYSSSCSQIVLVYLQPFRRNSLLKCVPQKNIANISKIPYFGSLGSFKDINVDTTKKFVTSACCDKQHANVYLQQFLRKTGQQR